MHKINTIQKKQESVSESIIYDVIFYNENDSNKILLTYDSQLPYIIEGKARFIGFIEYQKDYVVFINSIFDTNIIQNVIDTNKLNKNFEKIKNEKNSELLDSFDGKSYIFYIHSEDSIIFLGKFPG